MGYTGGRVYQHGKYFYVQIYWNGKLEKFWNVLIQGVWYPIKSKENGEKLLGAIREEIDRDREAFDPRTFRPGNPLSLGEYYNTWLGQIDAGKRCKRNYRASIERYAIPYFSIDKDIRKFKIAELTSFKKHLHTVMSEKGVYNTMSALKGMVRWAWKNEEIKHIPPFPTLSMGEFPDIEYLTLEQQDKILSQIDPKDAPIFRFAMEYGLRVGEARAIKRDAIKDGRVHVKRAFSEGDLIEHTKTKDGRRPELTDYAKWILEGITEEQQFSPGFVFTRDDGKPYTSKNLNDIWHEACKKAGIEIKLYNAIRHSLGCQLLDEGHDISFVMEVLGHTDPKTTRRYARRTAKKIGQVLNMRRRPIPEEKKAENGG